jgi:hypothetical protein
MDRFSQAPSRATLEIDDDGLEPLSRSASCLLSFGGNALASSALRAHLPDSPRDDLPSDTNQNLLAPDLTGASHVS